MHPSEKWGILIAEGEPEDVTPLMSLEKLLKGIICLRDIEGKHFADRNSWEIDVYIKGLQNLSFHGYLCILPKCYKELAGKHLMCLLHR